MAGASGEAQYRGMEPTSTARPLRGTGIRALRRSTGERLVAGVAGGLAEYFDVDVLLVRVAFVALALLGGLAVPLYLAAWLLVPEEGANESVLDRLLPHVLGEIHERRNDGTAR